jgi:peptide/nickel transport system substrate-binding protein
MWLEWLAGNLDYVTVPAENFTEAFTKRRQTLKRDWVEQGVRAAPVPLLDFIFRGFNMDDPVVGGYTEERKHLRQAMHLAHDLREFNDTFYNGINIIYDGPIPPGLEGHPTAEDHLLPNGFQGPDLERARDLLAKAGYPGGEGLPELEYWTSGSANGPEQAELFRRQMAKIGVRIKPRLVDFSQMSQAVHEKRAQMFSFAWGSDYPDGENNLALFYGPNEAPGANSFNYKRPEYDALYRQILSMPPSPVRTKIYEEMRDMVIEDCPYLGSMARTRFYLIRPWLKNCKPTENFWTWHKYLDLDLGARK